MIIGIPKETRDRETRVAATPDSVRKYCKKGFSIRIQKSAGVLAGFSDQEFQEAGEPGQVQVVDQKSAFESDLVLKINPPSREELQFFRRGSLLIALLEPFRNESEGGVLESLARAGVDAIALEWIPRTSRAQSMDVLSSQANIAGYRAVIEAARLYPRFFPMMMTSAGSAKPAKLIVLGAGVAGLQAIGTARRLGCHVEAYDVRPEVKEQIQSLGAKFIDLGAGEDGSGSGGYAKELSQAAQARQQRVLTEKLSKADIIISTANIPGRKAPVLITEEAVRGMRSGSVIVDLAAATGGNCALTVADEIVCKNGVILVGTTNYPALIPSDASSFFARNIWNLMSILIEGQGSSVGTKVHLNLEDDIIASSLAVYQGQLRAVRK